MNDSLPDNEDLGMTPPGQSTPDDQVEQEQGDTEPSLTSDERDYFANAIEIGKMTSTGTVFGHTVTVRSMSFAEELAVGLLIKKYAGSLAQPKAYKGAVVAACLESIDGAPFYTPIKKMSAAELVEAKYQQVVDYYTPFVDAVYNIIKEMEQEVSALLAKLGKSEG